MNTIERAAWLKTLPQAKLLALVYKAGFWDWAKELPKKSLINTLAPVEGLEIPTKG
jgi:hypothetical protein